MIHFESEPEREGKLLSFPLSIKSLKFIVPLLDLLSSIEAHSTGNVKNQRDPRDDKKVSHAKKVENSLLKKESSSGACKTYWRQLYIRKKRKNQTKQ